MDNFLDLLPVVDQAQRNKGILQFVHADTAGAIIIEGVEVIPQLNQLIIFEVDAVLLAPGLEPFVELTRGVKEKFLVLDEAVLIHAVLAIVVITVLSVTIAHTVRLHVQLIQLFL